MPTSVAAEGRARVAEGALHVAAGGVVALGVGKEIAVRGEGPHELGLGPRDAPVALARVVGGRVHLVDARGAALASPGGHTLPAGEAAWLRCSSPLTAGTADRPLEMGPPAPVGACDAPRPAWVRALGPLRVDAASLDARPVDLTPPPLRLDVAAGALLGGLALAALLGPGALWPLFGAPAALLSPVAPVGIVALFAGAAGVARGGPRGWAVAAASLVGAGVVGLADARLPPGSDAMAAALAPTVSVALFERKVDETVTDN
ncbi:MAG: hypothetical protein ACK4YP_20280, partial [Myxococcota bacterium]